MAAWRAADWAGAAGPPADSLGRAPSVQEFVGCARVLVGTEIITYKVFVVVTIGFPPQKTQKFTFELSLGKNRKSFQDMEIRKP